MANISADIEDFSRILQLYFSPDSYSYIWEFVMKIERTPEFKNWFDQQTVKSKAQIDARVKNIEMHGYFGDHKSLGDRMLELRWRMVAEFTMVL